MTGVGGGRGSEIYKREVIAQTPRALEQGLCLLFVENRQERPPGGLSFLLSLSPSSSFFKDQPLSILYKASSDDSSSKKLFTPVNSHHPYIPNHLVLNLLMVLCGNHNWCDLSICSKGGRPGGSVG